MLNNAREEIDSRNFAGSYKTDIGPRCRGIRFSNQKHALACQGFENRVQYPASAESLFELASNIIIDEKINGTRFREKARIEGVLPLALKYKNWTLLTLCIQAGMRSAIADPLAAT